MSEKQHLDIDFDFELIPTIIIICIFISIWLFIGEPDIHDAIIEYLSIPTFGKGN